MSDFCLQGEVSERYGLFDQEKGTARRSVVIVEKACVIRFVDRYTSKVVSTNTGRATVESDLDVRDILAEVDKIHPTDG